MLYDRELYRPILEELGLTTSQENELMDYLYSLVDDAIAPVFAKHPVTQALSEQNAQQSITAENKPMLPLLCPVANAAFMQVKDRALYQ